MPLLQGIDDPPGEGIVVEVHLDIIEAPASFLERMAALGFEDDPFVEFYPPEYSYHYTGRMRALPKQLSAVAPQVDALVAHVLEDARQSGVRMYVESELVRDVQHFASGSGRGMTALEGFAIRPSRPGAVSKADVHVEWRSGTVPAEVRALLEANSFYWVRTPATRLFPSEDIATLQPSTYADARTVYAALLAKPLPACTGLHLEQKLAMAPTHPDLPLPMVTDVVRLQPQAA